MSFTGSRFSSESALGPCSNRPFEVKHFQTIHHYSVDVAHGLALLFGIGTRALPLWDSRTRRNNLSGGLTVSVTAGPSGHTNSPHPSSREGHLSTAWWNSSILLLLSLIHISEPTRLGMISYAVFCLKKKTT